MKKITTTLLFSLVPYCANAASLFQADITVANPDGLSETKRFELDTAGNFFKQLTDKGFKNEFQKSDSFSGYNSLSSTVSAKTIYQGLEVNVYSPEGSKDKSTLVLSIPALGLTGDKAPTFTNKTRGEASKALENYMRDDVDGTYSKIIQYQIAQTPNSVIIGPSPTTLGGGMISSTFDYATNMPAPSSSSTSSPSPTTDSGKSGGSSEKGTSGKSGSSSYSANPLAIGVAGGTYQQKGLDVSIINVPISKAFDVGAENSGKKVLVNGQFGYVTVEQAASFQGNLGLAYVHPINDHWSLMPSVNYGAVGSQDLATLAQMFSASLSSNYQFNIADYDVGFVNMFGYYKTLPISINGLVSSDPDINNYVFKNGIFPSKVVPFLFGHDVRIRGIFTDTEFTGTKVFVRQYNEVGIELSSVKKVEWLNKATFGLADSLSLSGKYVFSIENPDGFEGYDIGISYDF